MPMACSVIARSPAVTCSPEATTASYSRASCIGEACAAPVHELVGLAGHGGDDDRDLMAGVDLAFHMPRDVADAVDVGDRSAAEFENETRHGGDTKPGKAACRTAKT